MRMNVGIVTHLLLAILIVIAGSPVHANPLAMSDPPVNPVPAEDILESGSDSTSGGTPCPGHADPSSSLSAKADSTEDGPCADGHAACGTDCACVCPGLSPGIPLRLALASALPAMHAPATVASTNPSRSVDSLLRPPQA